MNERISIGGQAVIEGVMMRSPTCIATAVRKPSGEIVYKKTPISKKKGKLAEIPFIRGAVMLFDALVMGIKELTFSANEAEEKEEEQISQKEAILTTVVSLGLGIGLFIVLPSLIGSFLFLDNKLYSNLLEAVLRLLFFILYIWLISFSKDVRRVMLIAIIVFSTIDFLFPTPATVIGRIAMKVVLRVILMPLIAGISYEIQRYSSKHLDNFCIKTLALPGLSLQKITTKEPDLKQLEVAIVAIKAALGENVENAREVSK